MDRMDWPWERPTKCCTRTPPNRLSRSSLAATRAESWRGRVCTASRFPTSRRSTYGSPTTVISRQLNFAGAEVPSPICVPSAWPPRSAGGLSRTPRPHRSRVRGEFTAQVLALHETRTVREQLLHPTTRSTHNVTTLRTQVETWASDIVRPIKISAQWPPGITASTIRFQEPGLLSEPIRPANMGFGFSYACP